MLKYILVLVLAFIIVISVFLIRIDDYEKIPDNYVTNVIDGDTFRLSSGQTVRILCVDTPEKGKVGYEEAKLFLESLILNKEVNLTSEGNDKDAYGRLLRYVYIDNTLVNREIILNNHSDLYIFKDDLSKCRNKIIL